MVILTHIVLVFSSDAKKNSFVSFSFGVNRLIMIIFSKMYQFE